MNNHLLRVNLARASVLLVVVAGVAAAADQPTDRKSVV